MGKTTLEKIWEEYLTLDSDERGEFLYHASETLMEQGHPEVRRAFLFQAIEDAFEAGDVRVAANATVELSNNLSLGSERDEARQVLEDTVSRLSPLNSFELGLCYRAMAWLASERPDDPNYENYLWAAIRHFDAAGLEEWSFPLTNAVGQLYLNREDWDSLQNLISQGPIEPKTQVAPIAITIRKYLLSRLLEKNLEHDSAAELLAECTSIFRREGHELYGEALEILAHLLARIGKKPSEFLADRPHLSSHLEPEMVDDLTQKAEGQPTLY